MLTRKITSLTRMHSSRMRTAHLLTVSRSICHVCHPPPHMPLLPCTPCHAPPAIHAPLPHTPTCQAHPPATDTPAMHAPHHVYPPCHTHPATDIPPFMHAPLPHKPPLDSILDTCFSNKNAFQ